MMGHLRNGRFHLLVLVVLSIMVAVASLVAHRADAIGDDFSLGSLSLKHVADIPLPGRATRLDYASLDTSRNLLFIAHLGDGEVIVFDTRVSRVTARIVDVSSVHGVLAVPELSRVYASATRRPN